MDKDSDLINIIKKGGVAVIPTDTIYGLVGLALNQKTVERIYEIKNRTPDKPFIILIGSVKDLLKFGVVTNKYQKSFIHKHWPGPVSIVLKNEIKDLAYLSRGTGNLSFRIPDSKILQKFLIETGPLVAPSANPEGKTPASNIQEAKKYFNLRVDHYYDGGTIKGLPSTLVLLGDNKKIVLRDGVAKIK